MGEGRGPPGQCCVLDTVCLNHVSYRKRLPLCICIHSFASSNLRVASKSKCYTSCYKISALRWVDGLMDDFRFYVLLTLLWSYQDNGDSESLNGIEPRSLLERIPPAAGFGTARSAHLTSSAA